MYEGERVTCKENRLLGEFELSGITPQPRGQAELVCTFEVDANGLLKVSAQDRTSGRKANITSQCYLFWIYPLSLTQSLLSHQLCRPSIEHRDRRDDFFRREVQAG